VSFLYTQKIISATQLVAMVLQQSLSWARETGRAHTSTTPDGNYRMQVGNVKPLHMKKRTMYIITKRSRIKAALQR
jgi:hypothetical protein